jgi:hypothetical protein
VETKVTIGDRAEFELGTKKCCITCENHLLAQDKTHSKQTNFYLCHMKTIQKQMKTYISFKHGQHDPKKMYALYMRFLCVSIFFKKFTWLVN